MKLLPKSKPKKCWLNSKSWKVMKFSAILFLIFTLQISAGVATPTVDFSGKKVPVKKVLLAVKKQTDYVTVKLSAIQKQLKGTVVDEKGEPVPGANIKGKGTSIISRTDADGSFNITLPDNVNTLIISYVGMETQEVFIDKNPIKVILKSEGQKLDDVVVIGYGTTKRKDITGAISTIKTTEIPKGANTSIDQALGGRAAGLVVTQTSGQPGAAPSVQIRGNASFASYGVLYVVDGVPIDGGASEPKSGTPFGADVTRSPLNFINPNDVESIEVLKDASAAAIYGARAGAGVILITTKRGKKGDAKVSYSFSNAYQQPAKFYDILNKHDYMVERNRITREKYLLTQKIAPYGTTDPLSVAAFIPKFSQTDIDNAGEGTNAIDAVTQSGFIRQHDLSISGGTDKTKYFISGNFLDQEGIIKTSSYKRYSGRINLDQMITDKLKVGVNVVETKSFSDNASIGTGQNETAGIILSAFYHPPTVDLIAPDGSYPLNPDYKNSPNPLSFLENTDETTLNRLLTSGYAEWEIIKDLKAKANFSYDQSDSKRGVYFPKSFLYGARNNGVANVGEFHSDTSLLEYTLAYKKDLNENHHINGIAGYSYQVRTTAGFLAGNTNFLTDTFLFNSLEVGEGVKPTVSSSKDKQVWASYFGRLGYDYKGKYILQGSIRRDGSSNFAENKKYGWFPSVSAGWKISSEEFMQKVPLISFLKLRASYGTTGNSNIGSNAFAFYTAGKTSIYDANYVYGNTQSTGVFQSQIANPELSWETAAEINLGLDFGLFNDRITGTVEVYNKTISDLLREKFLPSYSVVEKVASNVGKTQSRGFEFTLKTVNIKSNDFNWITDFNIAHYKDTWKERDPEVIKTLGKHIGLTDPIRAIYGYQTDGILQIGEAAPVAMPNLQPGMVKVKDVNGYDANGNLTGQPDGKLSSADNVYLGNTDPGYSYGIGNTFKYKKLDLSIFMYGMFDRVKYNNDKALAYDLSSTMGSFGWNALDIVKDRWASDNPTGKNPSGLINPYGSYTSSFFREKADFLKCRNITLGYTLTKDMFPNQKIFESLRLSVDVQNLFTVTPYSGLDPESLSGTYPNTSSLVSYPAQRSIILGLNVIF
ncbi:SusC/RagA family TonB-linked outer membrane protein [Flavobacterium sp. 245]|uniref:SusC/RagA family TonB-linked outer membrane protein n=1 Tax=Flavobacterium sp. 245 TaxID=2512115 RepID=UPI00105D9F09|nr:TonB-dependent receptor [Flavobacterium sp. 245]TDO94910.1 TonB-linked SusC/RagA family outer membrane protein [Flavobacterium sp. 245]